MRHFQNGKSIFSNNTFDKTKHEHSEVFRSIYFNKNLLIKVFLGVQRPINCTNCLILPQKQQFQFLKFQMYDKDAEVEIS